MKSWNLAYVVILTARIAAVIHSQGGSVRFMVRCRALCVSRIDPPPLFKSFKQGEKMSGNQEATIKISKLTHHQLRILKAEGNFKSYDALIKEVCSQWLGKNE